MSRSRNAAPLLAVVCIVAGAETARAADPGKAVGTFSYGSTTVTFVHAVETKVEALFDSSKQDTLVVLSDKPLGATAPSDDVELSLRARTGEVTALALRIDGSRLVNVGVFPKGLSGKASLPGAWFQYTAGKPGTGTLKLASREFDGMQYACALEFAAAPAAKAPAPTAKPAAAAPAKRAPTPEPKAAPAATSNIDKKSATTLLVSAFMQKNEHQAVELIKLGADPNGRDQYGVPMLNWAVMMCMPQAVQALVDRKASLTYQRAPGMTVMAEAGACPEAAKILKAAGAK